MSEDGKNEGGAGAALLVKGTCQICWMGRWMDVYRYGYGYGYSGICLHEIWELVGGMVVGGGCVEDES